jgi:virginiamycin B lyase
MRNTLNKLIYMCALLLASEQLFAMHLVVADDAGKPLATVMVTQRLVAPSALNLSDDGYPPNGVSNVAALESTRFTNDQGLVTFPDGGDGYRYRLRKPGYKDLQLPSSGSRIEVQMARELDPVALAAQKPANVWLSQLELGGGPELRKHFFLNCAFCHQQASPFMRVERTPAQWLEIIDRMGVYGARIAGDLRQSLADGLASGYANLNTNDDKLPAARTWDAELATASYREWPIGDGFSQMHDFILHPNGMVYVGDNLQDRIYEVNPNNGQYTVYKVPHEEDDKLGGFLGNRFKAYGKLNNYMGVHSFAVSPKDGHIFITPSMQRALLEFDPHTKIFTSHPMKHGFYPHTIRTDTADRVWFTLALSSQVAMFDRISKEFTYYDIPARNFKEWLTIKVLPLIFYINPEYRPMPSVDRESSGLPMPYGIDVAPDGRVWFARLYANDIGFIDPQSGELTMIDVSVNGPRRLRVDADNKVWMVAFQDGLLAKYDPELGVLTQYELPLRSEIPYALNVDRERRAVWVNGNQSDTILRFDIDTETWQVYPMSRQRTFTRDIEIAEDGSVFTSNSHFPSWQIEDAQPTLIHIQPYSQ